MLLKQIILGVSCGIFLGLSSVLYKVALDSVTSDLIYKKVLVLSFFALAFQSAIFGIYIVATEGKQNIVKLQKFYSYCINECSFIIEGRHEDMNEFKLWLLESLAPVSPNIFFNS